MMMMASYLLIYLDDILSDVGEGPDSTEDTILDQDFMGNEPRNYVAGYI